MIEIKTNPSTREIRVFGLLWLVFFGLVAAVAWWKPEGLVGAAVFLAVAWLVSLVFNSFSRLKQLAGIFLPALFGSVGTSVQSGVPLGGVIAALGGLGLVGAWVAWLSPRAGRGLYVAWMHAALPVGWSISHLVLAAVYYLVLTPIGLVMRLFGYDPMKRRYDAAASSYWVERKDRADAARYFRQF